MNLIDIVGIVLILMFGSVFYKKGFLSVLFPIAVIGGSVWLAFIFNRIPEIFGLRISSFELSFFVSLIIYSIVLSIIALILKAFIRLTLLKHLDNVLGLVFGLILGMAIMMIIVYIGTYIEKYAELFQSSVFYKLIQIQVGI